MSLVPDPDVFTCSHRSQVKDDQSVSGGSDT